MKKELTEKQLFDKAEKIRAVIKEKVEGKVIAEHDVFGHFYRFADTGNKIPSVTTKNILDKPRLIPWAVNLALQHVEDNLEKITKENWEATKNIAKFLYTSYRDDAGDVGTIAHDGIEAYINEFIALRKQPADIRTFVKNEKEKDYRAVAAARSAEAVFNKYRYIPVWSELLVGSEKDGAAGTLDLLVLDRYGNLILLDHKTSNSVNDFYAVQTAIYARCFTFMTKLRIKYVKVFKYSKEYDKYTPYDVPNVNKAIKAYRDISNIYGWINNGEEKLIKEVNKAVI